MRSSLDGFAKEAISRTEFEDSTMGLEMGLRFPMGPVEIQAPSKRPHIPSNGDHKALNRGTFGGLGPCFCLCKGW